MIFRTILLGLFAGLIAACGNISYGVSDGVPLADLDMDGAPPTEIVLAGADAIDIVEGATFDVRIDGSEDARSRILFERDGDTLIVGRGGNDWSMSDDIATITVTVPELRGATIGGSGKMTIASLTGDANVTIGGSGMMEIERIAADNLTATVAGSGTMRGAGTTETLNLAIGGSGDVDFTDVQVGSAEVDVGGSGSAEFASDGDVIANIGGSGDVRVNGDASCTANTFGSGDLVCG